MAIDWHCLSSLSLWHPYHLWVCGILGFSICSGFVWQGLDFVHLLNSFLAKCLYGPFFSAPRYLLVNRQFLAQEGLHEGLGVFELYWPM